MDMHKAKAQTQSPLHKRDTSLHKRDGTKPKLKHNHLCTRGIDTKPKLKNNHLYTRGIGTKPKQRKDYNLGDSMITNNTW